MASCSITGSNCTIESLEIAYQISLYLHSFVENGLVSNCKKTGSDFRNLFALGPNPSFYQTRKGLVLEIVNCAPLFIHTQFGRWNILNSSLSDWRKVAPEIKKTLGFKVLKFVDKTPFGNIGPFFAITKWENKKIELAEYKNNDEYLSSEQVKEVWNFFISEHKELEL